MRGGRGGSAVARGGAGGSAGGGGAPRPGTTATNTQKFEREAARNAPSQPFVPKKAPQPAGLRDSKYFCKSLII